MTAPLSPSRRTSAQIANCAASTSARFIGPRDWRDPAIERDLKTLIDTGKWVRGPDGN